MKSTWICIIIALSLSTSCVIAPTEKRDPSTISSVAEFTLWANYRVSADKCRAPIFYSDFECELKAREEAVRAFGGLTPEDREKSVYFTDLEKVYLAGFLREYIWIHIMKKSGLTPHNLRDANYKAWEAKNIPNHIPVVYPETLPMNK